MSSFTVQSAKYDYRVFEAATGRTLASFTIKGVAGTCAAFRMLHGDSLHATYPAEPDYAELKRLLEPLVTRDAG